MLLHILHKGNFAKTAMTLFERFAPGRNIYVFPGEVSDDFRAKVPVSPEAWPGLLESAAIEKQLVSRLKEDKIKYVFIHALTKRKAELVSKIKAGTQAKVFWVFLGAELYTPLEQWGYYQLYDEPKGAWVKRLAFWWGELQSVLVRGVGRRRAIAQGIEKVDFFCFWNEYDYQLLKRHFKTHCRHLDFLYYDLLVKNPMLPQPKVAASIMINHSASTSGNHLQMIAQLAALDPLKTLAVTTPLSYGDARVREETITAGQAHWGDNYHPLTEYLPQNEYYAKLNAFAVAIFGNRRQEAGANVFYLLAVGVKVFLRNDNSMLTWLRDKGFKLFCVETDLKTLHDLTPLPDEIANHNRQRYLEVFSSENEAKMMDKLLQQCNTK